ncbi:Uncharacterised protein [Hafnia alvei]|nr:hypothetical protein [Hafnia alvei]AMO81093.1 hypothetical protein DSM2777_08595 [Obesumbacterium proteus]STQ67905.1 Uncharacterised protein [Hafnia alvei]
MTSREQFEAWLRAQPHVLNVGVEQDGTYTLHEDRVAWEAWQASREAVELDIDWPEANDDTWKDGEEGAYAMGHEDGKDKVIIAVRKAIRAAGIKVKGE